MPSRTPTDTLSLAQPDLAAMDREQLVREVTRLQLRVEALREQRDERIQQLQRLEVERTRQVQALLRGEQLDPAELQALPDDGWQQRALAAEGQLAALLATRSMRLLRVPRGVYARVRAGRVRS